MIEHKKIKEPVFNWSMFGNDIHIGVYCLNKLIKKTERKKQTEKSWYEKNRSRILEKERLSRQQKCISEGRMPRLRQSKYSKSKAE